MPISPPPSSSPSSSLLLSVLSSDASPPTVSYGVDKKPVDVASMSAARDPSPTAPPTPLRDGFHLISREPIDWDINLTNHPDNMFCDITLHRSTKDVCACIAMNRPEKLHAFRPQTIREIQQAFTIVVDHPDVAVIVLTSHCNESQYTPAFCAGGDQTVRSNQGGYQDATEVVPKLRVLDLQIQMRRCAKPIVAAVQGYCVGGGHILHMLCDVTLCTSNSVFGQTGPRMGSFDAGYGCVMAADLVGSKRAREIWFLGKFYSAQQALAMGLVNVVEPNRQALDGTLAQWVRRITMNSPTAIAACKAALNAVQHDNFVQLGGELTRLFYLTKESQEGRDAFLQRRAPNFRSKM